MSKWFTFPANAFCLGHVFQIQPQIGQPNGQDPKNLVPCCNSVNHLCTDITKTAQIPKTKQITQNTQTIQSPISPILTSIFGTLSDLHSKLFGQICRGAYFKK